jgi:putative ABC transport system permease protein
MVHSNFRFLLRRLLKEITSSSIKIFGLALGIAVFFIVALFASYELGFEYFNKDIDKVFRIYGTKTQNANNVVKTVPVPFAGAIENITGIESSTHILILKTNVSIPNSNRPKIENVDKIAFCNSNYFDVFDYYRWVIGNPIVLNQPGNVVLTVSKVRLYFGDCTFESVIGKEVIYSDSILVKIGGVVEDADIRSDIDFTDFISYNTLPKKWLPKFMGIDPANWNSVYTGNQFFIKLFDERQKAQVELRLQHLTNPSKSEFKHRSAFSPHIQALADLHFNKSLGIFEYSRSVTDKSTIEILIVMAVTLLLISVVNFLNIDISNSYSRLKEFGIRQIFGGTKIQLMILSFMDSGLALLFSVAIAIPLLLLLVNYFNDALPFGIQEFLYSSFSVKFLILFIPIIIFLIGICSSITALSSNSIDGIKSKPYTKSFFNQLVNNGVTIFQLSFANILLITTIFVILQINYLLDKDLGFEHENIVCVYTPFSGGASGKTELANRLRNESFVSGLSFGSPPTGVGIGLSKGTVELESANHNESIAQLAVKKNADSTYLRLYNFRLLAGRNLQKNDSLAECVINETCAKGFGYTSYENILNRKIGNTLIVGVVEDFHTASMHNMIEPVIIENQPSNWLNIQLHELSLSKLKYILDRIKIHWDNVFPGEPINPIFLNDAIKRYYEADLRMEKIIKVAAGIAITISAIGLYGLFLLNIKRKRKEIGIRKSVGASSFDIWMLLTYNVVTSILIAFIIAIPVSYQISAYFMRDFAYKNPHIIIPYALAFAISLLVGLFITAIKIHNYSKVSTTVVLRCD